MTTKTDSLTQSTEVESTIRADQSPYWDRYSEFDTLDAELDEDTIDTIRQILKDAIAGIQDADLFASDITIDFSQNAWIAPCRISMLSKLDENRHTMTFAFDSHLVSKDEETSIEKWSLESCVEVPFEAALHFFENWALV